MPGQKYRITREDGHTSGGPMHYLRDGLAELGWPTLGKWLSVIFAFMCIGGSFGGGNMFQSNQAYALVHQEIPILSSSIGMVVFGLVLVAFVALVIIGGIQRIGEVAAVLVPGMCALYMVCGLLILLTHASSIPHAIWASKAADQILDRRFTFGAWVRGLMGNSLCLALGQRATPRAGWSIS